MSVPEDYRPSRDVQRLFGQFKTRDNRKLVQVMREFYKSLDWSDGEASSIRFFNEFEAELTKAARRLDVTVSNALGAALVIAAQKPTGV